MANGETQLDRIERKVTTLCLIITGDGKPEDGLIVRVDRVEQTQKGLRWFLRSMTGALIAAAIGGVIVALTRST